MKILLFSYEYPPLGGGVANAVFHLLQEWSKQTGIYVYCVTSSLNNAWEEESLAKNITLYRVPIGKRYPDDYHRQNLAHMVKFVYGSIVVGYKIIRQNKPDISLAFGYPGPIASWLFSWFRLPYVVALRGVDVPGYNPRFSWGFRLHQIIARLLWRRSSAITANSKWLANLAKKTWSGANIKIIPNGVDTELFKPVSYEKKFSAFTVTAGGTVMGKKKQLDLLIKGFDEFIRNQDLSAKQAQLLLIGDGDERQNLEKLCSNLKIEKYVRFVGSKNKKWIAWNLPRCHVFCLPSLAEGMSNAALEAMACGLPLILSDVGAAREMVESSNCGYVLHNNKNEDEIAELLIQEYKQKYLACKKVHSECSNGVISWGEVSNKFKILNNQKI